MMDNVKNKIGNIFRNIYTSVSPISKDSKFYEKGILTPDEFILAGDQLTQACPSWTWKGAITKNLENPALPTDKQFLQSQSRSYKRVKELFNINEANEKEIDEEWIMTDAGNKNGCSGVKNLEKIQVTNYFNPNSDKKEEVKINENNKNDELIKIEQTEPETMRTYDISITYDFYYLTPRFWLSGIEEGKPLNSDEIFQDIMAEYANKTVTVEDHPYLGVKQLSIHPCKHPNVLKYLTELKTENGGEPIGVHQALFLFLKFMASIMPTMEYDFTVDIELA